MNSRQRRIKRRKIERFRHEYNEMAKSFWEPHIIKDLVYGSAFGEMVKAQLK